VPASLEMRDFRSSSQLCSVVGMALNYPGNSGSRGFWETASGPGDVQGEVPYSRWNIDNAYSPDIRPGKLLASTRQASISTVEPELTLLHACYFQRIWGEIIYEIRYDGRC
jgi:hypothetical protein